MASLGWGFQHTLQLVAGLFLVLPIFAKDGLAEAHFRWPKQAVTTTRRQMRWFAPAFILLVLAAVSIDHTSDTSLNASVGRVVFSASQVIAAVFGWLILRPRGPVLREYIAKRNGSARHKLLIATWIGAIVAPLTRIRYSVVNPAVDARFASLVNPADAARGIVNSVLIREEIQFNPGNAPVINTEQIVLEFVANFSLAFVVDNRAPPFNGAPNLILLDDTQGAEAFLAATPDRLRSGSVDLSARTPDADPSFRPLAGNRDPGADGPLTRYRVIPNLDAAARVRSIRSEIYLPNVAP